LAAHKNLLHYLELIRLEAKVLEVQLYLTMPTSKYFLRNHGHHQVNGPAICPFFCFVLRFTFQRDALALLALELEWDTLQAERKVHTSFIFPPQL